MNNVSKLFSLIALIALSMQTAHGQFVDVQFTADEGFLTGNIGEHSDWYDQKDDYLVDTNGMGSVSVGGSNSYRKAINQTAFTSNQYYSVGIEFTLDRLLTNASGKHIIGIGFKESPTFLGDRVEMQLSRGTGEILKFTTGDNSGTSQFDKSSEFAESLVGFATEEAVSASDNLWFGYMITRGADEYSWSGSAVLSNLTTGAEVQSFDVAFDTTVDFFNDDSLYAYINSVNLEAESFVSNRVVERFSAGAELGGGEVFEQVEEVEFTAAQGYEAGALFGQQGFWGGNDDQIDTVVDSTANYVELTTNTYRQMTYTLPLSTDNGMLEVDGVFRFDRTINSAASGALIRFGLVENLNSYPKRVRVELRRTSVDQFSMVLAENVNGYDVFSDPIAESALGLDGVVTTDSSDDLQISLKLYPGTSTNDWSAAVVLSNLTAGTEVESFSVEKGLFSVKKSWIDSTLYGGFNSSASETDTFTSNRQVERFRVAMGSGPVIPPQPKSIGLVMNKSLQPEIRINSSTAFTDDLNIYHRVDLIEGEWNLVSHITPNVGSTNVSWVDTNTTATSGFYLIESVESTNTSSLAQVDIRTRARLLGYLFAEGSCANPNDGGDKFIIGVKNAQNTRALWCAQQMEDAGLLTIVSHTDNQIKLTDIPWDIPYAPVSWNTDIYMTFDEGLPRDPDNPGQWAPEVYNSQFIAAIIEGEGGTGGLIDDQSGWGDNPPHITELRDLLNEPVYDCDAYLASAGKDCRIPSDKFYVVRAFEFVSIGRVPGGSDGLVTAPTPPEYATR